MQPYYDRPRSLCDLLYTQQASLLLATACKAAQGTMQTPF